VARIDGRTERPHFIAAKMTDKGYLAVAVEYKSGYIIGRMYLDLLDIAPGVRAEDIAINNQFKMKAYCGLDHCQWITREQFDDRYERHCEQDQVAQKRYITKLI
jgi:hypothetical protein